MSTWLPGPTSGCDRGDRHARRASRPNSRSDGPEADRLRELAESDVETGEGGRGLTLTVKPIQPVFPVEGPKVLEVRLTNDGEDSATYVQAPITERAGTLYLPKPRDRGKALLKPQNNAARETPWTVTIEADSRNRDGVSILLYGLEVEAVR